MSRKRLVLDYLTVSKESLLEQLILNLTIKNVAPITIRNYRDVWNYFTNWYHDDLIKISAAVVGGWIMYLKQQKITVTTINTYLTHLRTILNFMASEGHIQAIKVKHLKHQEVIKETYTDEELKKLLEKPDKRKCSFSEFRNWTIINTLISTGIRRSTLVNLKIADIDLQNGFMNMSHTKNNKTNVVPISSSMLSIFKEYLQLSKLTPDSYLFPDAYGKQMKADRLGHIISSYNRKRGVDKTSVHAFRHTYAKLMIVNGCNVFKLQKLLGHSSLEMTRRYVELFSIDLKEGYDSINPLERLTICKKRIAI
ncbi:MAG: tyrosine-type recombinase/integrase [Saccharofermentanales bacterium]